MRILHKRKTVSTNLDAMAGEPGDVFTADYQSAGRGRLDHRWLSPPGANLLMSVVLGVGAMPVETVATLPLAIGLAVLKAVEKLTGGSVRAGLKWPNDVLIAGRKVAGILCERHGDKVIAGIGINVMKQDFPPEISVRAISLGELAGFSASVAEVRDEVISRVFDYADILGREGFAGIFGDIRKVDLLKGKELKVRQTDGDSSPVCGVCGGILSDGSLDVGGVRVYAGEAHVE